MNYNIILFFAILFIFIGCKKENSNDQDQNSDQPHCQVISSSLVMYGDTSTCYTRFDNEGKISSYVDYTSDGDSTVQTFFYQEERVTYSVYKGDTTYYTYNKNGLLSSMTEHNGRIDEYFYNETGQVVKTRVWMIFGSSKPLMDSTFYTWSNGNILSAVKYTRPNMGNWYTFNYTFSYDDKVNYLKGSGLPESDFRSWSKNNLTKSDVSGHPELTFNYNYPGYNSFGYPTSVIMTSQQYTYTMFINYQCQ